MAMMGGKAFIVGKFALLFALFSSFSKFFSAAHGETSVYSNHHHHHHPPPIPHAPPPPPPPPHYPAPVPYEHPIKRKSDKRFKRIVPINYKYSYYTFD